MTTVSPQPTLILSPYYTEDSQRLWRAATQRQWNVERIHGWRIPDYLRHIQEPIIYIESLMALTIAEELGLTLQEPPDDWLPLLPFEYRQRNIQLTTLGAVRQLTTATFIKPPNDKSFPARVYQPNDLPDFANETVVLSAEIVMWQKEFRCFILNQQLQTFSIYLREGIFQKDNGFACTVEEAEEMTTFITRVLGDTRVPLPPAVVMDVGAIKERGWAIVELNAAWGAGIYGCDPDKVLDVIRHAAEPYNPPLIIRNS